MEKGDSCTYSTAVKAIESKIKISNLHSGKDIGLIGHEQSNGRGSYRGGRGRGSSRQEWLRSARCFECNEFGHLQRNCPTITD